MTGAARMRVGVRRRAWVAGVVVLALVAGGCSSDESDQPGDAGPGTTAAPGEATVAEDPTFVEGDCWWDRPEGLADDVTLTCGTVEVPADRTDPDGGTVTLPVARFHQEGTDASAPPVVFLHGGPGADSLSSAPSVDAQPLGVLGQRDLVLYDQRGAGRATPSLNCPEKEQATLDALGTAEDWDAEFPPIEAAVLACRERLVGDGIDLDDYDTPASVEDLESLRLALGTDTFHLYGRSYGTRLALAYARVHPEPVSSLLIDSVYAPDVGGVARAQGLPAGAVAALTAACDAQASCATANGSVDEELAAAVAAFDAEPEVLEGTVAWGDEEATQTFTFTGADLAGGMFAAQYRASLIPALPSIIKGLASGDRGIVSAFVDTGVPSLLDMSEGAFFSFECADSGRLLGEDGEEAMRQDPGRDALYAIGTAEPFCSVWDVPPVPAEFNEPVVVDVPTLVYAGTLDPITPYAESEAQADRLPDARLVTVTGGGHGDVNIDDCTRSTAVAFWADPTATLPACSAEVQVGPFS